MMLIMFIYNAFFSLFRYISNLAALRLLSNVLFYRFVADELSCYHCPCHWYCHYHCHCENYVCASSFANIRTQVRLLRRTESERFTELTIRFISI